MLFFSAPKIKWLQLSVSLSPVQLVERLGRPHRHDLLIPLHDLQMTRQPSLSPNPSSRSFCDHLTLQGATPFLGSCYKVYQTPDTFVGAYQQCSKYCLLTILFVTKLFLSSSLPCASVSCILCRLKIGSSLVEITSPLENKLVRRILLRC